MIKSRIDIANRWLIEGWAFDTEAPNKAIDVQVSINGQVKSSFKNNIERSKILAQKMHPTGKCGFKYYLGDQLTLKDADVVSVSINGNKVKEYPITLPKLDQGSKPEKAKKVLVVGLGKSGTSKLCSIIKGSMSNETKVFFEPNGARGLEDLKLHKKLCQNQFVVNKSLFLFNRDVPFGRISNLYDRKVWILRDPRDRLISLMLYRWFKGHKPNAEKFERSYQLIKQKEEDPSSVNIRDIWNIVIPSPKFENKLKAEVSALGHTLSNLNQDWHILSYNDMVDEEISSLNTYLGFDANLEEAVPDKFKRVSRSNAYGAWKNWFTQDDVDFFKPIYESFINDYSLADASWTINENQQIDSKIGSEYIHSLFYGTK